MRTHILAIAILVIPAFALVPLERRIQAERNELKYGSAKVALSARERISQNSWIALLAGFRGIVADFCWIQGHQYWETKQWLRQYRAGKWDGSNETRDYFEKVTQALRQAYPKLEKPVLMVPVGDVLLELDKRIRAGKAPGLEKIDELYVDGIHFNNVGAFIVGTTFYSTMFKRDPRGINASAYAPGKSEKDREIKPELAQAIQEAVWEVVSKHPLSGVSAETTATTAAAKGQAAASKASSNRKK